MVTVMHIGYIWQPKTGLREEKYNALKRVKLMLQSINSELLRFPKEGKTKFVYVYIK